VDKTDNNKKSVTTQATHLQAHYPPGRRNVNDMTPQMTYFKEDRFVTALARPASNTRERNITPTVQTFKKT
jgi:hypothetical protein